MINSINDCAVLNNGVTMPWLGYGVFQIEDGEKIKQAVLTALNRVTVVLIRHLFIRMNAGWAKLFARVASPVRIFL